MPGDVFVYNGEVYIAFQGLKGAANVVANALNMTALHSLTQGSGQTAEQVAAAIRAQIAKLVKDIDFDNASRMLTVTFQDGTTKQESIPGGGTSTGGAELQSATLDKANNRIRFTNSDNSFVDLDGTDIINMTGQEIADELFTKSSRSLTPGAQQTFNIPAGGTITRTIQLGAINQTEANLANGGGKVRVNVAPLWTETSEGGFPAQVTATILLVRGGNTIQGTSVHLRGSQEASVSYDLPTSGNSNGDILRVIFNGADRGNGSNGNVRVNSASISEQGAATDAVTALATDAANQVVSPLRNEVAAVEKRSFDNRNQHSD